MRYVSIVEHMSAHLSLAAKVFLLEIKTVQALDELLSSWSVVPKALDLVGNFLFTMTREDETIEALEGEGMEIPLRNILYAVGTMQGREKQMRLLDSVYNMLGKAPLADTRQNPELQNMAGEHTASFAYVCELTVKMLAVVGADRDIKRLAKFAAADIEAYFQGQVDLIHAEAQQNGVQAVLDNVLHSNRRLRMAALEALIKIISDLVPVHKEPEPVLELVEHVRYLQVEEAKNLRAADSTWQGGKSDPYVVVFWNGKKIGQTSVCKSTLNPSWDEATFKLVSEPGETFAGSVLLFVYDHDHGSDPDDFLGQAALRFGHAGDPGGHDFELEGHDCPLLERSRQPAQGKVFVSMVAPESERRRRAFRTPNFVEPIAFAERQMAVDNEAASLEEDYSAVIQLIGVICRLRCLPTVANEEQVLDLLIQMYQTCNSDFNLGRVRALNLMGQLTTAMHCFVMVSGDEQKMFLFNKIWKPDWKELVHRSINRYEMRQVLYSSVDYIMESCDDNWEEIVCWLLEEQSLSFVDTLTKSQREHDDEDAVGKMLLQVVTEEQGRARLIRSADVKLLLRLLWLGMEPIGQVWALEGIPILLEDTEEQADFLKFKGIDTVIPYIDFEDQPIISRHVVQILWQCVKVMDDRGFADIIFKICLLAEAREVIDCTDIRPFMRIVNIDQACKTSTIVSEWALLLINEKLLADEAEAAWWRAGGGFQQCGCRPRPHREDLLAMGGYRSLVTVVRTAHHELGAMALCSLALLVHRQAEIHSYDELLWYLHIGQQDRFRAVRTAIDSATVELLVRQPWQPEQVFSKLETKKALYVAARALVRYFCLHPDSVTRHGQPRRAAEWNQLGWGAAQGEEGLLEWAYQLPFFGPVLNFLLINCIIGLVAILGLIPSITSDPRNEQQLMMTVFSGYAALEILLVGAFAMWATRDRGYRQAVAVDEPDDVPSGLVRWCSTNCTNAIGSAKQAAAGSKAKYLQDKPSRAIVPVTTGGRGLEPPPPVDCKREVLVSPSSAGGTLLPLDKRPTTDPHAHLLDVTLDVAMVGAEKVAVRSCCGKLAVYLEFILLVVDSLQLVAFQFVYHPCWTGREDSQTVDTDPDDETRLHGAQTFYGLPIGLVAELVQLRFYNSVLYFGLWGGCITGVLLFVCGTECVPVTLRLRLTRLWHRMMRCGCLHATCPGRKLRRERAAAHAAAAPNDAFSAVITLAEESSTVHALVSHGRCRRAWDWVRLKLAEAARSDRVVLWLLCPAYVPVVAGLLAGIPCYYGGGDLGNTAAEQVLDSHTATGGVCWGTIHTWLVGGSVVALSLFLPATILLAPIISSRGFQRVLPGHWHPNYLAARNLVRYTLAGLVVLAAAASPPEPFAAPSQWAINAPPPPPPLEDIWGLLLDYAMVGAAGLLTLTAVWQQYGLCPPVNVYPRGRLPLGTPVPVQPGRGRACGARPPVRAGSVSIGMQVHLGSYCLAGSLGWVSLTYRLHRPIELITQAKGARDLL